MTATVADNTVLVGTVQFLRYELDRALNDLKSANAEKDAISKRCFEAEKVHENIVRLVDTMEIRNVEQAHDLVASKEVIKQQQGTIALQATAHSHLQEYAHSLEKSRDHDVQQSRPDLLAPPPVLASGGNQLRFRPAPDQKAISLSTQKRNLSIAKQCINAMPATSKQYVIAALFKEHLDTRKALEGELLKEFKRAPKTFTAIVPEGYVNKLVKEGQQEWADSYQDHWSIAASLALKFRCTLSREKFNMVRHTLSYLWSGEVGKWVRGNHNGVMFPQLHSRYMLDRAVAKIAADTGLRSFDDGLGAMVELRELLRVNIEEGVKKGLFYLDLETGTRVVQEHGRNPEVMNVLDSARHHKGMKVTHAHTHTLTHTLAQTHTVSRAGRSHVRHGSNSSK